MTRILMSAVVAVLLTACGSRPHIGLSDEALTLEPDKEFEAKLTAVSKELTPPSEPNEAALQAYYDELLQKSGVPPAEFLLKIIAMAHGDVGDMVFFGPIATAAAKLPPDEFLRTVGPYAGTEKHKEMVKDAVMRTITARNLGTADQCADVLRKYGSDIPRGLISIFYDRLRPQDAAVMCAQVFADSAGDQRSSLKQIDTLAPFVDWDGHQLSGDTRAELLKRLLVLIKSEYWWVRRYAADVIYKFQELQQPEVVQPLLRDPEPLVIPHLKRQEKDLRRMREGFN